MTAATCCNSGMFSVFDGDFPSSSSSTGEKGANSKLPYSPNAIHDNDNEGMDPLVLELRLRISLSVVSQITCRMASIRALLEAAISAPSVPFQWRILRRYISNTWNL